ncbi:MAG: hypothetical protein HYW26_04325 [Candidatus Aenigmarchaeota archaeon]|nr:hypothetical protein [Candidatus Aenigmarchaeota archaeon]
MRRVISVALIAGASMALTFTSLAASQLSYRSKTFAAAAHDGAKDAKTYIEVGLDELIRNLGKYRDQRVSTVGYVGSFGKGVTGRYYHMYPREVGEFYFGTDGLVILEDPATSNIGELIKKSGGSRKFKVKGVVKADEDGGVSYFLNLHKAEVIRKKRRP